MLKRTLSRRAALTSLGAVALTLGSRPGLAVPSGQQGALGLHEATTKLLPKATRSRVFTWAPNLWVSTGSVGNASSFLQTIPVPDDFYAFRVGFLNMNTAPWYVTRVAACASNGKNDYINPVGSTTWVNASTMADGEDDDRVFFQPGVTLPNALTVAGSLADPATGLVANPRISWTDWTPLQSVGADANGMRWLFVRSFIPAQSGITYMNGTWDGYSGQNGGFYATDGGAYDQFFGGLNNGADITTNPTTAIAGWSNTLLASNRPLNGSIFAIIQVRTKNEGYTICQVGESRFFGTTTTSQLDNWALRGVGVLGTQLAGKIPIGFCCFAVGGYASDRAFGLSHRVMPSVNPSIVDINPWNGNENDYNLGYIDAASQNIQWARTMEFCDFVQSLKAIPVLTSPLPTCGASQTWATASLPNNKAGYQKAFADWEAIKQRYDMPIFDAYAVLGTPANEAIYECPYASASYTNDNNHMNDTGHGLLVQPWLNTIKPFLDLT